jgi:hypothetical protein
MTNTMQLLSDSDLDAVTGGAAPALSFNIGKIGDVLIGNVSTGNINTGVALGRGANSGVVIAAGINPVG